MAIAAHRWAGQAMTEMPRSRLKLDPVKQLVESNDSNTSVLGKIIGQTGKSNIYHQYNKGMEFIRFDDIPMQDWDFPDPAHPEAAVTVRNLRDAYESLADHVGRNPDESWRLYLTPGGIRAWNLTDNMTPTQPREMGGDRIPMAEYYRQALNSDPLYSEYAKKSNVWSSRLSSKPRRLNDFVAYPLATVGNGLPNPVNLDLVHRYHDVPIIENRYVSNFPRQLAPTTRRFFEQQLADMPTSFASPVIQRLEQQGFY